MRNADHLDIQPPNLVRCLGIMLFAFLAVAGVQAAPVVDWSGNYVSEIQSLNLPSPVLTGNTNVYAYSSTTTISPVSGYTAPSGKSGPFYGGLYITRSEGSATPGGRSVSDVGDADRIFIQRTGSAGVSFSGAAFIAFQRNSFLDVDLSDTVSFGMDGLTPVGSLNLNVAAGSAATNRFAVLNAGQWYLSSASLAGAGSLEIASGSILTSTWGAWSPTSGANGRLGDVPVSFDTFGSAFTDIDGFGYYVGWNGTTAQTINTSVDDFAANALVVPEPKAAALLIPAWVALYLIRRCRSRAA